MSDNHDHAENIKELKKRHQQREEEEEASIERGDALKDAEMAAQALEDDVEMELIELFGEEEPIGEDEENPFSEQ